MFAIRVPFALVAGTLISVALFLALSQLVSVPFDVQRQRRRRSAQLHAAESSTPRSRPSASRRSSGTTRRDRASRRARGLGPTLESTTVGRRPRRRRSSSTPSTQRRLQPARRRRRRTCRIVQRRARLSAARGSSGHRGLGAGAILGDWRPARCATPSSSPPSPARSSTRRRSKPSRAGATTRASRTARPSSASGCKPSSVSSSKTEARSTR